MARQASGGAQALAPAARLEWKTFNAGPSLIEALFAGEIDLAFVGPNPTITGYVRSQGEALRVVAGAVSGGASLVVAEGSGIARPQDFHGKRVASPQLGNTQDVALRAWLEAHGLKRRDQGGDVAVVPVSNADQLTLFLQKQLDAAWAPEPWGSRLVREARARRWLDERDLWPQGRFVTTNVIASVPFLRAHPEMVKRFLRAHVELTEWIVQHPGEAKLPGRDPVPRRKFRKPALQAVGGMLADRLGEARLQHLIQPPPCERLDANAIPVASFKPCQVFGASIRRRHHQPAVQPAPGDRQTL